MLKSQRVLYLLLAAVAVALALLLLSSWFFPIVDLIDRAQQQVMRWGAWSAIGYPLLFAFCNVLLLPGGILSVVSGFFFGLWWGFLVVLLGNSIGAAISFALSRWAGQRWFAQKLSRNRTLRALQPAVEREGWKIIFLSQLHPLFPASLLNYLYGLTRIRFRTYIFWTSVGRAPGLFLYTYVGTLGQLGLNLVRGKTHPRMVEYWTWGGVFVTTALLFVLLTRMALRAIQNSKTIGSPSRNQEGCTTEGGCSVSVTGQIGYARRRVT
jgi:uncharacterized membrane protein YdjX (TVP38/TMEM64 family)